MTSSPSVDKKTVTPLPGARARDLDIGVLETLDFLFVPCLICLFTEPYI
jgi:hypothetical protein